MNLALSKLSTLLLCGVLSGALLMTVAACTKQESNLLEIAPGLSGTLITVGSEVEGSISIDSGSFDFKHAPGANLSIGVAAAGPDPQAKNDSKLFMPASITKLVTTSLALKNLGAHFTFTTRVFYSPGSTSSAARDLTIIADGDPQVVKTITGSGVGQQALFNEIIQQLKKQGIDRIENSLVFISADERHDVAQPADGMEESDHTTCFGAVSQSFNFDWNCGHLALRNGQPFWMDANLTVPVETESQSSSAAQVLPIMNGMGQVVKFALNGNSGGKKQFDLPISDVKPWYARVLRQTLSEQGIDASSVEIKLPIGAEAKQILSGPRSGNSMVIQSEPLSALIQYTNKPSDNFLADSLFKAVAIRHGRSSDLRSEGQAAFREAIDSWLTNAGRTDLTNEIHLIDGAGLSHLNRVSPRAYMTLLGEMAKEPTFSSLWDSLPIAGEDGTLSKRMLGTAAVGVVRAKTGTLNGSYQLAGFIPKLSGDGKSITAFIPFVILSSVSPSDRFKVFELQARLASKLLLLVNPQLEAK